MAIKAILFDKDGTLIDYYKTWMPINHKVALYFADGDAVLAHKLLEHSGWIKSEDTVKPGSLIAAGTSDEITDCWLELIPNHPRPREELLAEANQLFLKDVHLHATPVTNLHDLFNRLIERGLILGVATSDSEAGAMASLGPFNILDMLDFVCGYDTGHGIKPGPGMVHGFCKTVGIAENEVAVVGDNLHDLHMARAAGALAIGVLTGTSTHEDLAPDADHILGSIDELESLFSL